MKKYFMFVAVAAAGMLASCSSDSLTAGPDPNIEPTQEERVPIQLSVASPSVRANTRGTGTVGGVGDGENKWYGQRINVFMFTKDEETKATTLNLTPLDPEHPEAAKYYDNAEMITPGTGNLTPTGSTSTNIGEAMLTDGTIQYYPPTGNYDFFGYHVDDAPGALDKTADPWTVSFTIDGSQDLLSTKAALTEGQTTTMATLNDPKDYYSAKSARKSVQPVLSFNHLLSRLSFVIIPGNDNAGGWGVTTPATTYTADEAATHNAGLTGALAADVALTEDQANDYNAAITPAVEKVAGNTLTEEEAAAYNATLEGAKREGDEKVPAVYGQNAEKAVYVQAIKVYSKTTGKMAVAWTGDAPEEMITWTDGVDPAWLTLKERPAYYKTDDKTIAITTAHYNNLPEIAYYTKIGEENEYISVATYGSLDEGDKVNYEAYQSDHYYLITDPTTRISNTTYNGFDEGTKALYNKGYCQANFVAADANVPLIALTPTYPVMHHAYDAEHLESTPIGEALIVAPSEEDYEMEVTLTQKVPTNWTDLATLTPKTMTYPLKIKAPVDNPETDANEAGFQKNISYQVNLTVYGFERIVVTTEIKPWDTGAEINVGQDE